MVKFSIILPTFDHGPLIRCAIQSVLAQTEESWQLLIIGDGSPPETHKVVSEYQRSDARVQFIAKSKGPRNGEIYRDEVIRHRAQGKYISYLSDDDIYFPDHLMELERQFRKGSNFINTLGTEVNTQGEFRCFPVDLASPYYQQLFANGENRVPLSNGAHTRSLYRTLPFGWRTTPRGVPTDLYMWQQILNSPHARPATVPMPTVLHFASPERAQMSTVRRMRELEGWFERLEKEPDKVRAEIGRALFAQCALLAPMVVRQSFERAQLRMILDAKIGPLVRWYFALKGRGPKWEWTVL